MSQLKIIISLFLCISQNIAFGQTENCISDLEYSQSLFKLEKTRLDLYKIKLTKLGVDHLNPNISNICELKGNEKMQIVGKVDNRYRSADIEIYLLTPKATFLRCNKKQKYKMIGKVGQCTINKEFNITVDLLDAFVLLFVNSNNNSDLMAVEISR